MQPNAGLAALLAGAALILLVTQCATVAAILGTLVLAIGGSALFEFFSGINLGIDTLLMFDREWGNAGTFAPGRMGPPGATSWTLIGIALVLAKRGPKARQAVSVLGLTAAIIASLSLIGRLFGADSLYMLPRLTIALQTATMIFAMGLGLIASASDSEPVNTLLENSGTGGLARRALPLIVILPVVLGYLRVRGQNAGLYDTAMGTALMVLSLIIVLCGVLWWSIAHVRTREESLRKSEGELTDFFENANVGMHWVGPTGIILRVNQMELDILGYTREEYEGHHIAEFHADRHVIDDILTRLKSGEVLHGYEVLLRRSDGSICHALINSSVLWEDGQFIHTRSFTRDVTDQKAAEAALLEVHRRKDEFLATLAHELRNPLAPIRNSLEIINLTDGDAETVREARGVMERQVGHMVRLIDDLVDIGRLNHNLLELRNERVEVASIVHQAVEICRPLAESAGHELTVSIPKEPIHLHGDPVRLSQVFGNLLTNACRYTPQGGQIWLTVERQGSDVSVAVKDTGQGISPHALSNIFELFQRGDQSLTRKHSGLGIGLTLAKRLVEMHSGSICVRSDGVGQGSEFIVRLPLLIRVPETDLICEVQPREHAPSGYRILVVDDNEDSADTLSKLVQLAGNEIALAHDGVEAIEKAESFRPHAILLDIGLPKMNGYDACRIIKDALWGADISIIALTGWGNEGDREKSRQAGFDGHLVKPVEASSLFAIISETVGAASRSPAFDCADKLVEYSDE